MDPAEYLPMFLAECREHLQELNVAIVALEQNPDDAEGVDAIFRVAHSVKGMTGTMGFTGMARLSHEMEEVFELVRRRHGGVERELIDAVFACLDALSVAVDSIEQDGEERIDPDPLIKQLRALVGRSARHEVRPGAAVLAAGYPGSLRARIEFAGDVLMPSVLAFVLLNALRDRGTVLASDPADDDLDGWDGRVVEVVCGADFEPSDIKTIASDTEGVIGVTIGRYPDGGGDGGEEVAIGDEPPAGGSATAASSPPAPEPARQAAQAPEPAAAPATSQGGATAPTNVDVEAVLAATASASEPPAPAPATAPDDESAAEAEAVVARPVARTVRVDAERLDQLMYYMGELVVHRTQLAALVAQAEVPGIAQAMQELERTSQALRAMVMKVRMIEVEAVLSRLPRLVRDLAAKLDKQVDLQISGADTELDRTVVDALGDPLVHLVRNAIDHGLESPQERVAAGKPAAGTLEVTARHGGGRVVITVRDDGRGVDVAAVAARARQRGMLLAGEELTSAQAIDLLFNAGFSTADRMTDISGRGVGMGRRPCCRPGARWRRPTELRGWCRDGRRDTSAVDARNHLGADRRDQRTAVRDPAGPRGVDACARRPHRAPCRRPEPAGASRRRCGAVRRPVDPGRRQRRPCRARGDRPCRRRAIGARRRRASRPARARHQAAASRARDEAGRSPRAPCSLKAPLH